MTIGLGPRHLLAADISAGPGDVLDHDGLAELRRQPFGDETRNDVGTGPRREGYDQPDRLIRPGKSRPEGRQTCHRTGKEGQELAATHGGIQAVRVHFVDTTYERFTSVLFVL